MSEYFHGWESEQAFKNELLPLIAHQTQQTALPTAITKVVRIQFFPLYYNTFDGWFVWVRYFDWTCEIWLVADLRGGYSDDDWFFQQVT